jgi:hypothetical protein
VDKDTIAMLKAPNNALIGEFIHHHPMGLIVWEQTRYEQDAYYCENNIIITNIVDCANNFSPITSTTSSESAEEYLSEYMVKGKASLKQAVPSLLAALDQIIAHPSKAEDIGSIIQTGIHLAQCTINSLITIGPYMAHRFSWASFKVNNFLNFCPLTTFDSSKCS